MVTALKGAKLLILTLEDDGSLAEVSVPEETDGPFGRLRAARLGPDGALYVTTTNGEDDQLLRIAPRDLTPLLRPVESPRHADARRDPSACRGPSTRPRLAWAVGRTGPRVRTRGRCPARLPDRAGDPAPEPLPRTHVARHPH